MKVLYIVDPENDFFEGGALPVPNSNKIVPVIIELLNSGKYKRYIVSEDWHPRNHTSFAKNHNVEPFTIVDGEMKWPNHCVQYTPGACIQDDIFNKLTDLLEEGMDICFLDKGMNQHEEEYSVNRQDLGYQLRKIKEVDVVGLATDYCVKNTVLSLLSLDKKVTVHLNGCAGVAPESTKLAIQEMKDAGAVMVGE